MKNILFIPKETLDRLLFYLLYLVFSFILYVDAVSKICVSNN